jgi:uncharacterized membrane protein YfcA
MLGVLVGALIGTRVLVKSKPVTLKKVFGYVIILVGAEMIYNGILGRL